LSRKGASISVHSVEAYLGDISLGLPARRGRAATGKILVLGSGPAGLMAAHDLHADGFTVNVLERDALVGGCLRHLPAGLVPEGTLDSEISRLVESGIAFETSCRFKARGSLPPRGYSALVLTTGLPGPKKTPLPLKLDTDGFILVDQGFRTSLPRVYAAGGAISSYGSITEAMASAREMAGCLLRDYLFPSPP
jgi:NADPH-dependent glutamate synthase beta subunit-like oxidoreductase